MSEVRDRQLPLRELYRDQPSEAISAKRARTSGSGDLFHGEVEVGDGYGVRFHYGIDRKVGGLHDLPNPGDLLLAALAGCLDSTIRMVADLMAVELTELSVDVTGDADVRGALMIDPEAPVGFRQISCAVEIKSADDPDRVQQLVVLAQQCCVTLQTLRAGVGVEVQVRGSSA
jgi:uncharacterized OsmC-like protein